MTNRYQIGVGALTILAALLRFFLIGHKTVWLDEAFSIWLADHQLWELWGWLVRIDQHPPLYYTLLHGWIGLFGDLQGPVRWLSALCSTLSVPIFYAGVRRLIDHPTALIAALILTMSPFHIRFAQEARMYGVLTLAVAAALYCAAVVLREEQPTRRACWGLAISQTAVMLTHNTAAVYFPVALNLAVFCLFVKVKRQRGSDAGTKSVSLVESVVFSPKFVRYWLLCQSAAVLLWSPWAWPFVVQSIGVERQFWLPPPTMGTIWATFHNFNFAFLPNDLPLQAGWIGLYTGLMLVGVWRLRRTTSLWLLGSLFVVPMAIALLVSLRRPIFYDRTLIWVTLPYYALIAVGIRTIGQWAAGLTRAARTPTGVGAKLKRSAVRNLHNPRSTGMLVQIGLLAIVFVLSGLSLFNYYVWFEKEGWDEAAAYVAESVQQDDLIVFNASWAQIPFEYYYRHYDLATERRGLPVDLFERGVLEPLMTEDDVAYLHRMVDNRPRVWLVYSHDWYTDAGQIIPREFGRSLRETERKHFSGLQLIRYQAR